MYLFPTIKSSITLTILDVDSLCAINDDRQRRVVVASVLMLELDALLAGHF